MSSAQMTMSWLVSFFHGIVGKTTLHMLWCFYVLKWYILCVQKNMQPHYKQQQFWMIYKQIFESFLAITLLLAGTETNPSPF